MQFLDTDRRSIASMAMSCSPRHVKQRAPTQTLLLCFVHIAFAQSAIHNLLPLDHTICMVRAQHRGSGVIRHVDTDASFLAVALAQCFHISELWIAICVGTNVRFRFIAAHDKAIEIGPDRCVIFSPGVTRCAVW